MKFLGKKPEDFSEGTKLDDQKNWEKLIFHQWVLLKHL